MTRRDGRSPDRSEMSSSPVERRYLGEVGAVAMAVAAWVGAWLASPIPLAVGIGVCVVAFLSRRPVLLVVGAFLLASSLAASAWAGLVPMNEQPYTGTVLLVGDPSESGGAVRADAKLQDGTRVEMWARGGVSRAVKDLLAGERLPVRGALGPPPEDARWLAVRHVQGRLAVEAVTGAPVDNDLPARLANSYRRTLMTGSYALAAEQRPLFLGFVIGDDRGQEPAVVDDFRGSGLSHLLVVSGQNVAFLLVVVQPLLSRLAVSGRFAATLVVLLWFAMLTRFEPSVLRATAMAAVGTLATFRAIPVSPVRGLSLAVTALLLIDPLLNASTGFRLSVAATAGIVLFAHRVSEALPGPAVLREAVGVTLAAQAGVAPLLALAFGGASTATLLANPLAVPVAAPIMMWGLTGGALAGMLGPVADGALSGLLHLPTRLMLGWVAGVARVAAMLPLGVMSLPLVVAAVSAAAALIWARRSHRPVAGLAAAVVLAGAVLSPAIALRAEANGSAEVARGATLWRSGKVAVLTIADATARPTDVLDGLRRRGISHLDLYVSAPGGSTAAALVEAVRTRIDIAEVWQPSGGVLAGARTPPTGSTASLGRLGLYVTTTEKRLLVEVDAG